MSEPDIGYVEPPEPPAGEAWCVLCLMLAKAAQQDRARALMAEGRDPTFWVEWDRNTVLRPARYRGLSEVPQLGAIDVCWHHLAGLGHRPVSGLAVPNGGIPPGLLRGRG